MLALSGVGGAVTRSSASESLAEGVLERDAIRIAFEDLPLEEREYNGLSFDGSPDFDYNDWIVDIEMAFETTETDSGESALSELRLSVTPVASSDGFGHELSLVPGDVLCDGTYLLERTDDDGETDEIDGEFEAGETEIELFDTKPVFPDAATNITRDEETCTKPAYTAELVLKFESECVLDKGSSDDPDHHGESLPIDLRLTVVETGETISAGDVRLLTAPTDWQWPLFAFSLWDVYEDVSESEDEPGPSFDEDDWYDGNYDEGSVFTRC